jgi:hypothetical protein
VFLATSSIADANRLDLIVLIDVVVLLERVVFGSAKDVGTMEHIGEAVYPQRVSKLRLEA